MPSSTQIVNELKQKLRAVEQSFRIGEPRSGKDVFPAGVDALNRILPKHGIRNGGLMEWLADGCGVGVVLVAFQAVISRLSEGQPCVVIDERKHWSPIPLTTLGVDLDQLLIVHPQPRDTPWAVEQSFRCRGVGVTAAWLGPQSQRVLRRLQLAAEAGMGVGLLFRPIEVRRQPTWADVRLLASPQPAPSGGRRLRIEVLYGRGAEQGKTVEVEWRDESPNHVHLVPALAYPNHRQRAT